MFKSRKEATNRVLQVVALNTEMEQTQHIRHFSYFKSEESARQFSSEVTKLGYLIEQTHANAPGALPFSVRFSRVEVPTEEVIEAGYKQLGSLSEKFDGEYDGFEVAMDTAQKSVH